MRLRTKDIELIAYEMWLAAGRRSSATNQMQHFKKVPRAIRDMFRSSAKVALKLPFEPTCLRCGCTEFQPCLEGMGEGCGWWFLSEVRNWGICTACHTAIEQPTLLAKTYRSLKAFHGALEAAKLKRVRRA